MKNKQKYLSILGCFIFSLIFSHMAWADENEWQIKSTPFDDTFSLYNNRSTNDFSLVCNKQTYFILLNYDRGVISSRTTGAYDKVYKITIDHSRTIELYDGILISNRGMVWHLGRIRYNKIRGEGKATGSINEYKTLFQLMLNAKESLSIETTDADNQKLSLTFGVKGLRDGLLEMNQRCGRDFQYYSGIPLQGVK